ncbi:MAG TPA: glycosyltransferase family 39 protein [Rariglobus sp.]|nr:glycosyltransferase family 39 protein [Rariglobus sp.]
MVRQAILFTLIAALAVVLGFITFTPIQAIDVVIHAGYAVMFITYAWFAYHLAVSLKPDLSGWRGRLQRRWPTAVFLLLAALYLHVQERHEYKIVADELVIGNTAMQMHYERSASLALRAYDYANNFTVFTSSLDKRPLAFPFLLATVHDITGYRVENVFWLNGAVSLIVVVLIWLTANRLAGAKAGHAAVLLLCGIPLVAQNATGAGFELYNMMMIVLTLWLGMRYAEKPDSGRLSAFVLAGIILAQVRYESVLFVLPVGATVLWVWWRERRTNFNAVVYAAPVLMLLVPLQHNVFKMKSALWQLEDVAGATAPFGPQYFYDNVGHALNFLFSFDGRQPNSWLLGVTGIVCAGFALLMLYREYRKLAQEKPGHVIAVIFAGGLFLHTMIILCYFWGKWDDPVIRRLSLPAHVLLIVCVAFVWAQLFKQRRAWDVLIFIAGAHIAFFAAPASARHVFTQENFAASVCNWVSDYISENVPGSAFSVDDLAGHVWFLHRKSNVNPERLSINWEGYARHFEGHSFSEYLVVQRILVNQTTGERSVSLKDDFGGGLELESLVERTFAPFYIVRISRVKAVNREKLKAWATVRSDSRAQASASGKREMWLTEPVNGENLVNWIKALP